MKDYLKEILKLDSEMDDIFSEDEKKFIIQERALVNQTLTTHHLTKEFIVGRVKYLYEVMTNYKINRDSPEVLSPGYMEGKAMVEGKLELFKLLRDNLEEGLTYRGVLNKVSANKKKDYNKIIAKMATIS